MDKLSFQNTLIFKNNQGLKSTQNYQQGWLMHLEKAYVQEQNLKINAEPKSTYQAKSEQDVGGNERVINGSLMQNNTTSLMKHDVSMESTKTGKVNKASAIVQNSQTPLNLSTNTKLQSATISVVHVDSQLTTANKIQGLQKTKNTEVLPKFSALVEEQSVKILPAENGLHLVVRDETLGEQKLRLLLGRLQQFIGHNAKPILRITLNGHLQWEQPGNAAVNSHAKSDHEINKTY